MAGQAISFSEADLAATAAAYNPALHEAPCVVGHPAADGPAYGWAKALVADGSNLFADVHQVNPEFAEQVKAGAYKKISASFYPPTSQHNPTPGAYALRHIGFLGAQPPAVKGLKPVEFADADDCVEIELAFSEVEENLIWVQEDMVRTLRALRERIVEKEGAEEADKVLPTWRLDSMAESVTRSREALKKELPAPPAATSAAFTEPTPPETTTVTPEEALALQARNDELTQQLAASQATMLAQAKASKAAEHAAFAEAVTAGGAFTAADKGVIAAILGNLDPVALPGTEAKPVEFGEGDAKQPLGDAFKAFLKAQPKRVEFSEQASRERVAGEKPEHTVAYAEGTPKDQIELDQRIRNYAAAHKVSYALASTAIAAKQ